MQDRRVPGDRLARLAGVLPVLRELGDGATMTEAAHRLGMSQPALSRAMVRWETELSVAVIKRSGRGIVLTEEGQLLATAATSAMETFESSLGKVLAKNKERPVRLGSLRSIASDVATLAGNATVDRKISFYEGSASELFDLVVQGGLDAAILGPRPSSPDLEWVFLRKQAFHLVVPKNHSLAGRGTISLTGLQGETFVAMDAAYTTRDFADELCSEADIDPDIAVISDSTSTLMSLVGAGMGLCILPASSVKDPSVSSVQIVRADGSEAVRDIGIVYPQRRKSTSDTRAVVERIIAAARVAWA